LAPPFKKGGAKHFLLCIYKMSTDFEQFKLKRINNLRNIYSLNCKKVTQYYNKLIYRISRSSSLRKSAQIGKLMTEYKNQILFLTNKLDADIQKVMDLVAPVITPCTNKRGLMIGINYVGTPYQLNGCINDVASMTAKLTTDFGFTHITALTDETELKPTRDNILSEFTKLLADAQSGDLLFVLYSGHGSYILDKNGDETDKRDEMIITSDLKGIIDDDLKAIIQTNLKKDVTLFAMFDSCFSGTILDLRYQYLDSLNYDTFTENDKQLETEGNVLMISGCTDNQTSADANIDSKYQGAMTWSMLQTLQPNITWSDLLKNMRTALKGARFTQLPQMSSGKIVDITGKVFL
jgi:hypothetical protein